MERLTRAWRAEFDGTDGRTIAGIAVPFNSPTQIYERGEVFMEHFAPGAFRDSIAKRGDRVKILGFHDGHAMPLGKPTQLTERGDGLYIEARISETAAGNDIVTLVRDGVLDGFSVGFSVPDGGETRSADRSERTITRADLHEVSLVNFPAYDDARITSIREAETVLVGETGPEIVVADEDKIVVPRFELELLRWEWLKRKIA